MQEKKKAQNFPNLVKDMFFRFKKLNNPKQDKLKENHTQEPHKQTAENQRLKTVLKAAWAKGHTVESSHVDGGCGEDHRTTRQHISSVERKELSTQSLRSRNKGESKTFSNE